MKRDTLSHLVRFLTVMLAVDAVGLLAWSLFPEGTTPRTYLLFGTLLVAPIVAFLVTYGPEVVPETD
ncbi:hypothetical protein [Halopelagius fulvigenes]|uniref:Uncharacterized protein n=1 Tax=Halopelagius fulvigenes TaxID=1198324 RepID=A0ABD5U6E7_9EURY